VMGGEVAAAVLAMVKRESLQARGKGWSEAEEAAYKAEIRTQYETQGHPYYATARLWDDGIIDPARTREVLGRALAVAMNAPTEQTHYGVFRM
jgi:3-methylcrotonyl-CoA carboxylase beta subunit